MKVLGGMGRTDLGFGGISKDSGVRSKPFLMMLSRMANPMAYSSKVERLECGLRGKE
jgi:hypothetical protein